MTENMKELSVNEMEQVNGGYDTYIVVKGDTLFKISRRYGVIPTGRFGGSSVGSGFVSFVRAPEVFPLQLLR